MTQCGPVRLTIDRCIQAVPLNQVGFKDEQPGIVLSENHAIVEFKFRMGMPVVFKELVEKFAITPGRISKYRLAVVALGLVEPPVALESNGEPEEPICLNS